MKYIKEYNHLMWWEINSIEYLTPDFSGDDFVESEIDIIKKLIPERFKYCFSESLFNDKSEICIKKLYSNLTYFRIKKSADEWYYVEDISTIYFKYYKCDQINGLEDCLKNILKKWN